MNKRVSVRRYIVKHKHLTFLLPGFLGLIIFYFLPFFITLRFSLSDTAGKVFAGLKQYKELINSSAFRLAAGHSTIMALGGCVLLIPISLYLAFQVNKMERFRKLCQSLMLLPMVIPSAVVVVFLQAVLPYRILYEKSMEVLMAVFLWKYIGYHTLILSESLKRVPAELIEAAEVEGAGRVRIFVNIILPFLIPAVVFSVLMITANSFRLYREAYLLYGPHPGEDVYMISHYINNAVQNLNYPKMSAAAVLTEGIVFASLLILIYVEKKISEGLEG